MEGSIGVFSTPAQFEYLLWYAPTILFVEHDREFTNQLAAKVIELENGYS